MVHQLFGCSSVDWLVGWPVSFCLYNVSCFNGNQNCWRPIFNVSLYKSNDAASVPKIASNDLQTYKHTFYPTFGTKSVKVLPKAFKNFLGLQGGIAASRGG
jgi:hypothetical protein